MPRKKKRSSWGCPEEVRPGVWRIRYWADTPQGRKRLSRTVRGTRTQADDVLSELRRERGPMGGTPTVGAVWDSSYLPLVDALVASGQLKPNTRTTYAGVFERHVRPAFGHVPVSEVTAGAVQDWLLTINTTTAGTAKAVLVNVMDRAVQLGHARSNPARGRFAMARTGSHSAPKGVYTLGQLALLDKAMRGSPIEAAYLLMAHAGLRVGESLAVHARDIAFERTSSGLMTCILVDATVDTKGELAPTKTRKTRRAFATDPWASRLAEIAQGLGPDDLLTHDGFGGTLTNSMARNVWAAVKFPESLARLPMRNLRNSYSTYMRWELSVPGDVVSKLLGHSSQAVTETYYDRPTDDSLMVVVAAGAGRMSSDLRTS